MYSLSFLSVLEGQKLKSKCQWVQALFRGSTGGSCLASAQLLVISSDPCCWLVCRCITPVSASIIVYVLLSVLCFLFLQGPVVGLGPTLIQYDLILTNYISKTLFPNNVTFWGLGWAWILEGTLFNPVQMHSPVTPWTMYLMCYFGRLSLKHIILAICIKCLKNIHTLWSVIPLLEICSRSDERFRCKGYYGGIIHNSNK